MSKDAQNRRERAEFERIIAGELPEGWRDVLLEYKRGAIDREPLASGIFISAEINDGWVGREVEVLKNPSSISGDPELPGFTLELAEVWDPDAE